MDQEPMIKFYGTNWCGASKRAKKILIDNKIEFKWFNIDEDVDARDFVKSVNNGKRSVPTIVFPNGEILVEPSTKELEEKIMKKNK